MAAVLIGPGKKIAKFNLLGSGGEGKPEKKTARAFLTRAA
jgi:hypothetical protein